MFIHQNATAKSAAQSYSIDALRHLCPAGQQVQDVAAKELLFCEGDRTASVYEVIDGMLCTFRLMMDGRRQITGFAGPGDLVGLAQGDSHRFNCQAVTGARVRRISRSTLMKSAAERPEVGKRLLAVATAELASMQDYCLMLSRKSAQERVASFLLGLLYRQTGGEDADGPVTVDLAMKRRDIADYLGLSVETVSRTLTALKNLGVIDVPHGAAVVINDIFELEELAEAEDERL